VRAFGVPGREEVQIAERESEHDVADRARGALLGLAVGDALGATVEFMPPGSFELVTDMIGGGPHRLQPGEWTDDTSMALCLAESLVECGGFDATDQMRRYVRWYREGYLSSTGSCSARSQAVVSGSDVAH
jgi:ADP-ribosyl-[dinitrogen reductase] hydrolase